eukprot:1139492-Pelagomonas_calceolata.AAC.3
MVSTRLLKSHTEKPVPLAGLVMPRPPSTDAASCTVLTACKLCISRVTCRKEGRSGERESTRA